MIKVTDQMVFSGAVALHPELFSTIPHEAHRAASPFDVEVARNRVLYSSRLVLEAALSVPVPAQEAEPVAWYWYDKHGCLCIAADSRKPEFPEAVNPLYLHPTPAHSGEREALERAASQLVNSELAQQIRKLVSGWNGDGVAEEYRMGRHDDALGVTLPTNCGAIYMLDEVIHELRAALEGKQP